MSSMVPSTQYGHDNDAIWIESGGAKKRYFEIYKKKLKHHQSRFLERMSAVTLTFVSELKVGAYNNGEQASTISNS